ncbi:zinc ribbon domain-containing protein [Leucobacter sp. GX24907]
MPSYSFLCSEGCRFDGTYTMADVPQECECRVCGAVARRLITAPHLSKAGTATFAAIDRSARSAHEPEVVGSLPSTGAKRSQPVTRNPLHAKLPRN